MIKLKTASRAYAASYSRDGSRLAVGSGDGQVRYFDLTTGELIQEFMAHSQKINHVAHHPAKPLVATASRDGWARVWNLENGEVVQEWRNEVPEHGYRYVAYAPDGGRLCVCALSSGWPRTGGHAWIYEERTGVMRRFNTPGSKGVYCAVFSPQSRSVALGISDVHSVIWDPDQGPDEVNFDWRYGDSRSATDPLRYGAATRGLAVEFSPDGQVLATGAASRIVLWDVAKHERYATLMGHERNVHSLAFDPSGHWLASASADCTVRFWSPRACRQTASLHPTIGWLYCVRIAPDGLTVAVSGQMGVAIIDVDERLVSC